VEPHGRYGSLHLPWFARHHLDVLCVAVLALLGLQVSFCRCRFFPTGDSGYTGVKGAEG
jgi:hypothetical protein